MIWLQPMAKSGEICKVVQEISVDATKKLLIPGDAEATVRFAAEQIIEIAGQAIRQRGAFTLALAGGSTPKAIYQLLTSSPYKEQLDWTKVHIFFGDERAVSPDHPNSNYKMAMDSGFSTLPIPANQIHRMVAEVNIEENALAYEKILPKQLDLIMLGVGEDGHTASLFPETAALTEKTRLVLANFVPQKKEMRMTLTYPCINSAAHTIFYLIGPSKSKILLKVLGPSSTYPASLVGSKQRPALWVADLEAAAALIDK